MGSGSRPARGRRTTLSPAHVWPAHHQPSRPGDRRAGPSDDPEPSVLGEVGKVLHVEGGQRQVVDEAAGGDPSIVVWARSAAARGVGGDLALLSHASKPAHLDEPQFRSNAHRCNSARVTKVMPIWAPSSSRSSVDGSVLLMLSDATSVSK